MAADTAQKNLGELEALAERLGIRVCYEPMAGLTRGSGGLCKVRGELRVIMDRRLKPPERVQVLADALRTQDTDEHYVSPAVRR
ncbi:MAG: hypothetical protein KC636_07140, partial [Myxococcales bacterium]|nr:hypothetical protein [Myxococcales bacterium]